jgi:hypothetical protein
VGFERIVEIFGKIKYPTCKTGTWSTRTPARKARLKQLRGVNEFQLERISDRAAAQLGKQSKLIVLWNMEFFDQLLDLGAASVWQPLAKESEELVGNIRILPAHIRKTGDR